jgi:hypothetical protein
MLALHVRPPRRQANADSTTQLIELGAHLLRIAIDLDAVERGAMDRTIPPVDQLIARERYDPEVLDAAERMYREHPRDRVIKTVSAPTLRVGMILAEDVRLATGNLLVARGYEVTASFIERIKNFPPGMFAGEFRVIAS